VHIIGSRRLQISAVGSSMDGWDHGRPRATASPAAPLRRLHEEKKSRAALTASPLDSSPLGYREAEATRDRRGGGEPNQGLRPATLPAVERRSLAAGSPAVAPPPGRPCSPVRLCCAASSEPPPQLLVAGSLPDLPAPDAQRSLLPCAVPSSSLAGGWPPLPIPKGMPSYSPKISNPNQ